MSPDTLRLDRRFPKVGRIARASGTTNARVFRKIDRMLTELYEDGRLDLLRGIRDGLLTPMQVYDAWRRRALAELPIGDTMPLLAAGMRAWIESARSEYSTNHIGNMVSAARLIEARHPAARIADAPRVLEELRASYGSKYPTTFNMTRAMVSTFIRSRLKRSHQIWIAVNAVERRKVKKRAPTRVLSVADAQHYFPHPGANPLDACAWAMLLTGMGPKEYWGRWETQSDRVHILGTKRAGRVRDVPLVRAPSPPQISREWFTRRFRKEITLRARITPYDLRRSFAQWMELAGIVRARRRLYMGHGSKDVTDLYERSDVTVFLAEDAKKLRVCLGMPEPSSTENPMVGLVK